MFRDALFQRTPFRRAWEAIDAGLDERRACRLYVGMLHLAASHACESQSADWLDIVLDRGETPDPEAARRVMTPPIRAVRSSAAPVYAARWWRFAVLLKVYIYGYLNAIASSQRLEREAGRNGELMWLTGRLAPDHKTVADFRKDHGPAIQRASAQFVLLCRRFGLFSKAIVALDGGKFKAVNSRDNNFTVNKVDPHGLQSASQAA